MVKQFLDITGVTHLWGKIKEKFATKSELSTTDGKAQQAISQLNDINQKLLGKQDKLVSGTNIKTIGGQSILGAGDVTIPQPDLSSYATKSELATAISNPDLDKVLV